MNICELQLPAETVQYNNWIHSIAPENLWQSLAWKDYQQALGRHIRIYTVQEHEQIVASALVVIDTTTFGFSTWEIPRGPISKLGKEDCIQQLIQYILEEAKKARCLTLFISPEIAVPIHNWKYTDRLIFPEATIQLDLSKDIEDIYTQMKPKGRYNIKVATKAGIEVRHSTEAVAFADLHCVTAQRNNFKNPRTKTYQAFLDQILGSFLLYAYAPDVIEPIASLIGVCQGNLGIYYYGASNHAYRNMMAPYALQDAAIHHCKAQGCTKYDLFGIAPPESKSHAWEGVTRFKQQFGGDVVLYPAEQCTVLRPIAQGMLNLKRRLK